MLCGILHVFDVHQAASVKLSYWGYWRTISTSWKYTYSLFFPFIFNRHMRSIDLIISLSSREISVFPKCRTIPLKWHWWPQSRAVISVTALSGNNLKKKSTCLVGNPIIKLSVVCHLLAVATSLLALQTPVSSASDLMLFQSWQFIKMSDKCRSLNLLAECSGGCREQ